MENTCRKVKFKVLKLDDIRKSGSSLEINKCYSGLYFPGNNCVHFTDINKQNWSFWVGDTCIIMESEETNESAKFFKVIYETPKKILYKSPTAKEYTFENGIDELKETVIIGEDDHSYLTREISPGTYTGIHKSRLVNFLNLQLSLF
ncbi:hypothetical protein [Chryseobacterium oncorhynchi]|uniref:Uncharacterized protein n=1 Tax=Chryseobacterium oncorhynchi TaxID=741074 RepID=A0A316WCJ6_9FLAO|nr:hypothetical protein [Chryseobacterium oncorhynchi]PWN59155.1 hypothetical protein C1638_021910 [Chryseobacterium oncorhynchi]